MKSVSAYGSPEYVKELEGYLREKTAEVERQRDISWKLAEDYYGLSDLVHEREAENKRLRARVAELEGPEFTLVNKDLLREIERLREDVAEADRNGIKVARENERVRSTNKRLDATVQATWAKNEANLRHVERLVAKLDEKAAEVERLRAELRRGCERDPLHQCPNCRQALEEAS
jgi:chromosome segregation ATPase